MSLHLVPAWMLNARERTAELPPELTPLETSMIWNWLPRVPELAWTMIAFPPLAEVCGRASKMTGFVMGYREPDEKIADPLIIVGREGAYVSCTREMIEIVSYWRGLDAMAMAQALGGV